MKKYFGITLVVMLLMVLFAVPSFALANGEELLEPYFTHDLELDAIMIEGFYFDGRYTRWDKIENSAFRGAEGITSVNLASGNGNILETNVDVTALAPANSLDLNASIISVSGVYMDTCCCEYMRWDSISDNAFRDVMGITSVNMSSGNGNALQTNVGIEVNPGAF
jgi:hypothetical protein